MGGAAAGCVPAAAALAARACGRGGRAGPGVRTVYLNQGFPHKEMEANKTSTTKYTPWPVPITYPPKALFEQYRRVANIYFTIVAALSLTPYSPVRPWTTFLPLGIVLGVSMVKEGIEDYRRYKSDKEVNSRIVEVYDPTVRDFVKRPWSAVNVGDVIIVQRDEYFPADLLFLGSETEEGLCYIETMGLDGETNLKIRKALD